MLSENSRNLWFDKINKGCALEYAPKSVRDDKDLVLASVRKDGMNLAFASDRLRDDIEVVATAIKQNFEAIKFASLRIYDKIICLLDDYKDDDFKETYKFEYMYLNFRLENLIKKQIAISLEIDEVRARMLELYDVCDLKIK